MKLSVLTATLARKNRSHYFRECIQTVLPLLDNIEWRIHIDSETTEFDAQTQKLLNHPNIHISQEANGGLFYARNILLHQAKGEFVLFLDDDDLLKPLEVQKALGLAMRLDVDWLACGLTDLHESGEQKDFMPRLSPGRCQAGSVISLWQDLTLPCPVILNSTLIKPHALLGVGGFPALRQAGDLAAVMNVCSALDGHVVHESIFFYRKHQNQWLGSTGWHQTERKERKMVLAQAEQLFIQRTKAKKQRQAE